MTAGREIFATWTPKFKIDRGQIRFEYYTDSNAFELGKRPIRDESDNLAFSETLRPVDSVIKMCDHKKTTMLSVWNDRPQAGAVHDDGTMKLLIDRRTKLQDLASLGSMVMDREDDLVLNFRVKMSPYEETSPSCAQRVRSLFGTQSQSFAAMKSLAHIHAGEY